MKCQCVKEFNQPLIMCDWPDPQPTGTEVLIKIKASGVCHSDLHIAEGGYDLGNGKFMDMGARGVIPPLVLGHEIVGTIAASGPDADKLDETKNYLVCPWIGCGECEACKNGEENYCTGKSRALGVFLPGGFAEYVLVPHSRYLIDIGTLEPALAAPLACSGVTTFAALDQIGEHIYSHNPIVIFGAGGLGLMSLQILKALGGKGAVVVDIDEKKRQVALQEGALAVVNPLDENAIEQIKSAVGGNAKGIIDLVGAASTVEMGINIAERAAKLIIVGLFGGSLELSTVILPLKALKLNGSYVGNLEQLRRLVILARDGKVAPIPVTEINFSDIPKAIDNLKKCRAIGRQVVVFKQS